jgi:heat shock protein HslJ
MVRRNVVKYRLLALALISALGACGSDPAATSGAEPTAPPSPSASASPPASTGSDLESSHYEAVWELRSGYGPEGDIPLVANYPITMEIEGKGLNGKAACNGYGMTLRISGNSFVTRGASINQAGCTEKVERSESTFIAALLAAEAIERDGRSLTLRGPDTLLKFDEREPPEVAKLVGRRWELETLLFGADADSRAMPPVEPAFLILHEDGSFEGHTGCAPMSGEWISSVGQINFPLFTTEPPCPKRLDEQHRHQDTILGNGFRAKVKGEVLTLTGAHGFGGLVYRSD